MFKIVKYHPSLKGHWDQLVKNGKNTSFLFYRDYMDYHSDRFTDHSVIVYDSKGNALGCIPACEKNSNTVFSHAGLTYGAFVIKRDAKLMTSIDVIREILKYYSDNGFETLFYKSIPSIYNDVPADEVNQALFHLNAKLYRREAALVVHQKSRIKVSGNIKREANKAKFEEYTVSESNDLNVFWNKLLIPNLKNRYGLTPAHSLAEIERLKGRFPEEIRLFMAKSSCGSFVAGTLMYLIYPVAHCQYIASDDRGRKSGALNLLFTELLDNILVSFPFFDLGIAHFELGKKINLGMLGWKERIGGRSVSHDFYEIKTQNYTLLDGRYYRNNEHPFS